MQTQQRSYTPDEYLTQEEVAEFRSEYRDGEIVSMTGASINHNQIAGNVYTFLSCCVKQILSPKLVIYGYGFLNIASIPIQMFF